MTTIQDATGRPGFARYGVPAGGACDPWSARLANRLVGNADDSPLLEATLEGPSLRFEIARPRVVAITGADLGARLDGITLRPDEPRVARPGSVLRCTGRVSGLRAYLAIAGGFAVEHVLGSAATDLRSGFGGVDGRALRTGDRLSIASAGAPEPPRVAADTIAATSSVIRVLEGPHRERFAPAAFEALCEADWTVSEAADRTGMRLEGGTIQLRGPGVEVASLGLPAGAIQVPPDARPIVMLADRPVTGGYAVLACMAQADLGYAAQLAPGDEVRFVAITPDEAIDALRQRWAPLERLETVAANGRDAEWAGALG
jgi:biotin-dependent carboxylase-like uncharacterized protein